MTKRADAWSGVTGYGSPGTPSPQADEPMVGTVKATGARVTFTVEDYDGGKHVFGPAPYHRPSIAGTPCDPPPVGAACLVVFVGAGIERPVVVAWW